MLLLDLILDRCNILILIPHQVLQIRFSSYVFSRLLLPPLTYLLFLSLFSGFSGSNFAKDSVLVIYFFSSTHIVLRSMLIEALRNLWRIGSAFVPIFILPLLFINIFLKNHNVLTVIWLGKFHWSFGKSKDKLALLMLLNVTDLDWFLIYSE